MPGSSVHEPQSKAKMTIRVYTVDCHGIVTQDRGTVAVLPHNYEPCSPPCAHEGDIR